MNPTNPDWAAVVSAKLKLLRKLKPDGAAVRFAKPVPLEKLEAFEARHELRLPADYRAFLLHVGNGGGGPDYGIAPLRPWRIDALPRVSVSVRSKDGEIAASAGTGGRQALARAASLQRPFPLVEAWSVEEQATPFDDDATPYDGCLELAEIGCGYTSFLVVNGPRAGEVWIDYSAAMHGGKIEPLAPTFTDWFEAQWLDDWLVSALDTQIRSTLDASLLRKPGKKAPQSRYHDDILRWQDCFAARDDRPTTLLHGARLALYLGQTDDFDRLSERAAALGMADTLFEPLWRLRYRQAYAEAEGSDVPGMHRAAEHAVWSIRRALAANRNVPQALLQRLATDESAEVRKAVALNPGAPQSVLLDVVDGVIVDWQAEQQEDSLLILDTVARRQVESHIDPTRNENDKAGVQRRIAKLGTGSLGPWAVRAAILSDALAAAELEALAGHPSPVIRHAVALAASTPEQGLHALARDGDATVREAVASRSMLSPALFEALHGDDSVQVRRALAGHPQAPESILRWLCVELRRNQEVVYALGARALPEALAKLHTLHPDFLAGTRLFGLWPLYGRRGMRALPLGASFAEVRELGIYSHPSYPEPLLAPHIAEQYNIGGYEMGLHPWLSAALMDALSRNEYAYCRGRVAERIDVTETILLRVAEDAEPIAREMAARNPRLPLALWQTLAEDVDDVRRGAASNPMAPVDGLVRLASSPSPWVRREVLLNPRTPAQVVDTLGTSPEPDVRKWAALAPALSAEMLERLRADANETVAKAAQWRQLREHMLD